MRISCLALLVVASVMFAAAGEELLQIWHFDVGQADSTFLLTPSKISVLFDCGELSVSSTRNADQIAERIEELAGRRYLDYFVISHFHLDHIGYVGEGGLWGLLEMQGVEIGTLIVRDFEDCPGNVGEWSTYFFDNDRIGRVCIISQPSDPIDLGDGVSMTIVSVNGEPRLGELGLPSCDSLGENDLSLGVLISYGDYQEWIGGDLSGVSRDGYKDVETYAAARIGDIEVLRVNHHGSPNSTNGTFLGNLDPEVSIISVGEGNRYGHPDSNVVERLSQTSDVYMTSSGTEDWGTASTAGSVRVLAEILVTSDGYDFSLCDGVTGSVLQSYIALPVTRIDADGDGYYAEIDLDDSDPDIGQVDCTDLENATIANES